MLDPGQTTYLRKLTRGFDGDQLERVYDDYINKTFEDLVELAQRERREMDRRNAEMPGGRGNVDRGGSESTYPRVPATPSSAASAFGHQGSEVSRARASLPLVVKAENLIDLTQDDDADDTEDEGEIDHEPPPSIRDTEPSEFDGGDISDLSSVTSDGNDLVKNPPILAASPAFQARLDRLVKWLENFEWRDGTDKTTFIDHCWNEETSADDANRLFTSRDALRLFLRRWAQILGARSAGFSKLYLIIRDNSNPSAQQRYGGTPQKSRKRRRDSYGPSSFVASDDEDSYSDSSVNDNKSPIGFREKNRSKVKPPSQQAVMRVERILKYADSYGGWDIGVIQHFSAWVVKNDLQAIESKQIDSDDALKTIGAVGHFLARIARSDGWAQSTQLKALLGRE